MKNFHCLFIAALFVFIIRLGFAQTNISAGNVSGTWTKVNSPFFINGEITIPNGESLTIEPGVKVVFMGHYKFNVQGRLLAVGTQEDTIRFGAADKQIGWHSIRFDNTPSTNDTSKFFYCSFKYGNANTGSGLDRSGGAMLINRFDKVLVSDCLFDSNSQSGEGWHPPEADGGIFIYYASSKIANSTFSNNIGSKSSAIGCVYSPNSIISNNVFFNNSGKYGAVAICYYSGGMLSDNIIYNNFATEAAGGILIDNGATPMVTNNVIIHNQGVCGGVLSYKSANPILINNTIVYNNGSVGGGGIAIRENAGAILINNILYGNTGPDGSQVNLYDASADPVFVYCNIQGGKEEFGGAGAGINYSGRYENNIGFDPFFVNTLLDDYRLSDLSPCIGSGIDTIKVEGIWYKAPSFCFNGNPRPSPIGTKPDIGACESALGLPVPVELTSFTASASSNDVTLNWSTATELNNQGFEVQRKFGSNGFATIGSVKGNGTTTSPHNYTYVDKLIDPGKYFYRLKQIDFGGKYEYSQTVEVNWSPFTTYKLEQNYPNPFNPTTAIGFGIPVKANVRLSVLNILGEEIKILLNEEKEAGYHSVEFNSSEVPSGVYFYQLKAGNFIDTKKLILLK